MAPPGRSILLIDNYDSFTYILREYLGRLLGYDRVYVAKNDQISIYDAMEFAAWVISPGPGLPASSGNLMELLAHGMQRMPILGICLGHQAIGESAGASLQNLGIVRHGATITVTWTRYGAISPGKGKSEQVGLYHSWVIDRDTVPDNLKILATDEEGHIMAVQYKHLPVFGVQFHPESILTDNGSRLISQFLCTIRFA